MKGLRILQRLVKRVVLISLGGRSSCFPAHSRSAAREGKQISIYINGPTGNDNNTGTASAPFQTLTSVLSHK
jgi:hypothetical protein